MSNKRAANLNTKTTPLGNLGKIDPKTTTSDSTAGRSNTAKNITQPNNC